MTQEQFYHSRAWKRLARAFLMSRSYLCELCDRPADLAHHVRYITPGNLHDPEITLNVENLQAVCLDCHNTIHFGAGGAVFRGLEFTPDGDLIKGGTL